jgi:hypothetical protein
VFSQFAVRVIAGRICVTAFFGMPSRSAPGAEYHERQGLRRR